jgi:hypothetical protein
MSAIVATAFGDVLSVTFDCASLQGEPGAE